MILSLSTVLTINLSIEDFFFVDLVPYLGLSTKCPIAVIIGFQGYLLMPFTISPGNVARSFLITLINVDTLGLLNVSWRNTCNSAANCCWYALFALCCILNLHTLLSRFRAIVISKS